MKQVQFIDKEQSVFFATLRTRVEGYFKSNNLSKYHNRQMVVKTIVLLTGYIVPFIFILFFQFPQMIDFMLWLLMGFSVAGIGMSVMHDANHGAYSKSKKVNYWMGHTLNLLGGSVFNWKMQHNVLHHTYTNIIELDDDVENKLILRFSPHTRVRWYHRFQYVYAFLLYGILTLYWALFKDFVQFRKYIKDGINREGSRKNNITLMKIIGTKIIYFTIFFVLPIVILDQPVWSYILGFLLMHFVAGIILTVIFQLAHSVENTTHPLPDASGTIENNWAIHQLNTTVNFSRNNKLITWYLGGLNFQVEHHLFPNICHVHYPAIAPLVKQTAEEFGVPYLENNSIWIAIGSHIRALKAHGR